MSKRTPPEFTSRAVEGFKVLPANWIEMSKPPVTSSHVRLFFSATGVQVIVSEMIYGRKWWRHVSISRKQGRGLPSYEDIMEVKQMFIGDNNIAIQVLPKKEDHYSGPPGSGVLHLFMPIGHNPLPNFLSPYGTL